ncbi:hypothetical protein GR217_35240 [Rhizobium leguminosarum]|uniref:Uncharacterized protein n=1 Tax=Rhizobium ruizarguesonis TaxID=2081791 RepID=A0AAE4YX67_9HYPH|nr:hypothetical protein [Rhizobium ruizarguesonis]NEI52865.1 hypothetical protein [Rhizobium ruizarguesonis]
MQDDWRSLTDNEKRIVKKLLFGMDIPPSWEIQEYVGHEIDEYGSLALLSRGDNQPANDMNPRLIASGYFDDDNQTAIPIREERRFERASNIPQRRLTAETGNRSRQDIHD